MAKNESKNIVTCRDCFWANLLRYDSNPVLADCRMKPDFDNAKFPYERDVASRPRHCAMHKYQDPAEKFIQPLTGTRHHPIAACVTSQGSTDKGESRAA